MQAKMYNWNGWIKETRPDYLNAFYKKLLIKSGFHIKKEIYEFFEPYGFTALYLLSESHFAIHTFPEESKSYIELSSCVKEYFDKFMILMEKEADHDKQ